MTAPAGDGQRIEVDHAEVIAQYERTCMQLLHDLVLTRAALATETARRQALEDDQRRHRVADAIGANDR